MKVDYSNYEAYLLDQAEGRLSAEEQLALHQFLKVHPDLREENPDELPGLKPKPSTVDLAEIKWSLKRESTTSLPLKDYLLIAHSEQLLSDREKQYYQQLKATHPEFLKEEKSFTKIKLKSDQNLCFPNKNTLYRKTDFFVLWFPRLAVASVVLLIALAVDHFYQASDKLYSPLSKTEILDSFMPKNQEAAKPKKVDADKVELQKIKIKENKKSASEKSQVLPIAEKRERSKQEINHFGEQKKAIASFSIPSNQMDQTLPLKSMESKPIKLLAMNVEQQAIQKMKTIKMDYSFDDFQQKISLALSNAKLKRKIESARTELNLKRAQLEQKQNKNEMIINDLISDFKNKIFDKNSEFARILIVEENNENLHFKLGKIKIAKSQ